MVLAQTIHEKYFYVMDKHVAYFEDHREVHTRIKHIRSTEIRQTIHTVVHKHFTSHHN